MDEHFPEREIPSSNEQDNPVDIFLDDDLLGEDGGTHDETSGPEDVVRDSAAEVLMPDDNSE